MRLPRISQSQWIAVIIVCILVLWMVSGMIGRSDAPDASGTGSQPATEQERTEVQIRWMRAEKVTRYLELQGHAEAERVATVRAETSGRVIELPALRGIRLKEGAPIAELAMNDRQARLAEAKALVEQRQSEYAAAQRLSKKGYQGRNRIKEAKADLAAAKAKLAALQEEIANVRITAPFAGVLETRPVEIGEYMSTGDEIATVVDDDPLRVIAHVPQQKVNRITVGGEAEVTFITGDTAEGIVTLLSNVAADETRTYRVEVEVANAGRTFRPGMSATVHIPTDIVRAHFVSPALFSLDTEGRLGIKTVNDANEVVFHPIDIVRGKTDGVWIAGLPTTVQVITVGQGFVRAGEKVKAMPADNTRDGDHAIIPPLPGADSASSQQAG